METVLSIVHGSHRNYCGSGQRSLVGKRWELSSSSGPSIGIPCQGNCAKSHDGGWTQLIASPPLRQHPVHRHPPPVKNWEVDVDDFIGAGQGNRKHQIHVKRVLRESLDAVLRPFDCQDGPHCQEPASMKKILKGDATRATHKVVLGWIIDTITVAIQLPAHRILRLFEILDSIAPTQRRTTVNKWEKLLGDLRSMVLASQVARGCTVYFRVF
jgi:hypothetical protein